MDLKRLLPVTSSWLLPIIPLCLSAAQEPADSIVVNRRAPISIDVDSTAALLLPPELAPLKRFYGPAWRYLPPFDTTLFTFDTSNSVRWPEKRDNGDALVTSGTLFRGLAVTSGQGALLSGGLDLQVQGILSDGVFLQATFTDRNLPVQPEGNTRALEELDQVKLAISGPWGNVTAGDFILRGGKGPLTSFSRKLEGMTAQLSAPDSRWKLRGAVAGSKGRFRSQPMSGVGGRQGPYRLSAEDGSESIVVLAGTEKVWLDGQLLQRGDRFDYTIDYQTGELFFTPRHAIYAASRINVDFEYSSLVYSQTTGFMEGSWDGARSSLMFSAYSRRDDPASGLAFSLSAQDRELLRQAGEADTALIVSGATADSTGGYSLLDGHYTWVGAGAGTHAVAFHRVGAEGSYRRLLADNRLVYQWVPPGERSSGDAVYAPFRKLVAPTSNEVLTARYDYMGHEAGRHLSIETAISRYDLNRLSTAGAGSQSAGGYAVSGEWDTASDRQWVASVHMKAQGKGTRFQPLGRWDDVEMVREWNLGNQPAAYNWTTAGGRLENSGGHAFSAELGLLEFGPDRSDRVRWSYSKTATEGLMLALNQSTISGGIDDGIKKITAADIKYNFKYISPYVEYFEEGREGSDSLGFSIRRANVGAAFQGAGVRFNLAREERIESYAGGSDQQADLWRMGLNLSKRGWGQLESDLALNRQKSGGGSQSDIGQGIKSDYLLGAIRFRRRVPGSPWWIDLRHRIERMASETRAVLYDSVGAGLGRYRYDPNYDSYLPDEAGDFIRRVVPVGQTAPVVAARSRLAGQMLLHRFSRLPSAVKKWTEARVAWQVNIESRSTAESANLIGSLSLSDPAALFYRGSSQLETSLQRSKGGPRYALRYSTTANLVRLQTTAGLDGSKVAGDQRTGSKLELRRSHAVTAQSRRVTLDARIKSARNETLSSVNSLRNINISSLSVEGTVGTVLLPAPKKGGAVSGSLTGRWMRENNAAPNDLGADLYSVTLGLAQPIGNVGRLRLDWELLSVTVTGDGALPLAMAEGLPAGFSSRLRFSGQVPLAANLLMTLSFFSRNPAGQRPVRTANLELRTQL